jgi:hypothetical protein
MEVQIDKRAFFVVRKSGEERISREAGFVGSGFAWSNDIPNAFRLASAASNWDVRNFKE